jgi:adenylosuccinate lyase
MTEAVGELTVHADRMRANIERTSGSIFAERVVMLLAPGLGRETAIGLVSDALARSRETGRSFREVLLSMPDVTHVIPRAVLERIDVPEDYLGVAEALRLRLLGADS